MWIYDAFNHCKRWVSDVVVRRWHDWAIKHPNFHAAIVKPLAGVPQCVRVGALLAPAIIPGATAIYPPVWGGIYPFPGEGNFYTPYYGGDNGVGFAPFGFGGFGGGGFGGFGGPSLPVGASNGPGGNLIPFAIPTPIADTPNTPIGPIANIPVNTLPNVPINTPVANIPGVPATPIIPINMPMGPTDNIPLQTPGTVNTPEAPSLWVFATAVLFIFWKRWCK